MIPEVNFITAATMNVDARLTHLERDLNFCDHCPLPRCQYGTRECRITEPKHQLRDLMQQYDLQPINLAALLSLSPHSIHNWLAPAEPMPHWARKAIKDIHEGNKGINSLFDARPVP